MVLIEALQIVQSPADGIDGLEGARAGGGGGVEVEVDGDGDAVLQPVAAVATEEAIVHADTREENKK